MFRVDHPWFKLLRPRDGTQWNIPVPKTQILTLLRYLWAHHTNNAKFHLWEGNPVCRLNKFDCCGLVAENLIPWKNTCSCSAFPYFVNQFSKICQISGLFWWGQPLNRMPHPLERRELMIRFIDFKRNCSVIMTPHWWDCNLKTFREINSYSYRYFKNQNY